MLYSSETLVLLSCRLNATNEEPPASGNSKQEQSEIAGSIICERESESDL